MRRWLSEFSVDGAQTWIGVTESVRGPSGSRGIAHWSVICRSLDRDRSRIAVRNDPPVAGLNGDGIITAADLGILLGNWDPCP
jgi:hypothetical protein